VASLGAFREVGLVRADADSAVQAYAFGAVWTGFVRGRLPAPGDWPALDVQLAALAQTVRRSLELDPLPDVSRAVRGEHYKLIATFTPGRAFHDSTRLWHPPARVPFRADQPPTQHPPLEFYDLETDALEQHNLAADQAHAAPLSAPAGYLQTCMRRTADPLLDGLPKPPLYRRTLDRLNQAAAAGGEA
jgi:hypothetical protein